MRKAIHLGVPPGQLRLLPHGLEREEEALAAGPAAAERPFVLYFGRLSVEKGVRLLPGLAAALGETASVRVVGEGPLEPWLRDAAGRAGRLELLGRRSDAELAELRRRAAAVVIPSLFYEHFCYAAAEALLDARPVVAARIGAIPELVEHERTGLLVSPGSAAELAAAARRALEDPAAAAAWARAGRERVLELARPERHLEGLLEIYREAGSRGRAAA